MKLYDLERGKSFKLLRDEDVHIPPAHAQLDYEVVYKFRGTDGMYSRSLDPEGNNVHFAAWTEVVEVSDD